MKIHDRNPLYVQLADKYTVRSFVEEKIGKEFLNELLGVYESPSEINWSALPNSFVLKATHGSGMNILMEDKTDTNLSQIQKQLARWLQVDYSKLRREWVYRDIPRKIIAEHFLYDANGKVPLDYKVFCFNGEPRYIQVDVDRFGDHTRAYFDTKWERQPFSILYEQYTGHVDQPIHLDTMIGAARALARDIPFVRVDFYALPKLVFGEMTFFPECGTGVFAPTEWDLNLGQMIRLP